ncbi:MAG: bifunctional folylpolyglutamate synthase/dihydrofolate synthase [Deltaproteobacteria bacterium]|nr:bifunctional folylpolyglutamate synthase/dihydrofolate synthase [Deltaproteobacteria bacterium]
MLLRETQAYLDKLAGRGVSLGLDRMRAACADLGHPERAFLPVIVAGTNGKGSVSSLLYALALKHGVPSGLYTSPNLVRVNERISYCGTDISDGGLDALVAGLRRAGEAHALTYFEFLTLAAFEHFRRLGVLLAVLEVGMGGRLDATNTADAIAAVITPVGLDHTAELGPDLASIAREKAAVIRPGIPVVSAAQEPAAAAVIGAACATEGARLCVAGREFSFARRPASGLLDPEVFDYRGPGLAVAGIELSLLGPHQAANASLALAAFAAAAGAAGVEPDEAKVRAALLAASWPGRFEVVAGDPPVVLDGAHNPHGARALVETLRERAPCRPVHLVFGALSDKDYAWMAAVLAPAVSDVVVVCPRSSRSADPAVVAAEFERAGRGAVTAPDAARAVAGAAARAKKTGGLVLVSGSLYLVGEASAFLRHRARAKITSHF